MCARDLLAHLGAVGCKVTIENDKLMVRPASLLTEPLRGAIRRERDALVTAVREREARPFALTRAEGDAAHAVAWDERAQARFLARARFANPWA